MPARPSPATPTPARRGALRALLALALLPASAARAGFNFFTSEYTASREELQAQIARRFPLQQGYGNLFAVTLSDPQLALNPQANRAALTARVHIASPLLNPPQVRGLLTLSSALRYDSPSRSLCLERPQAERIQLEGVDGPDAVRLQRVGAVVAQEALEGQPLRQFSPEELTVGRKTYEIGQITVINQGIKVQLL